MTWPREGLLLHGVGIADVGVYDVIEGIICGGGGGWAFEFLGDFIGFDGDFAADGVFHGLEVVGDGFDGEAFVVCGFVGEGWR